MRRPPFLKAFAISIDENFNILRDMFTNLRSNLEDLFSGPPAYMCMKASLLKSSNLSPQICQSCGHQ